MRSYFALVLVGLLFLPACATNQAPDAAVAHYGTTVLGAVTELQKGITAATDAGSLPVATAQTLTGHIEKIHAASGTLGTALKTFHSAATLDLRKTSAAEIQANISAINTLIGEVLKVNISGGSAAALSALVGNVIQAVGAVQAELAKGLGA